MPTAPRIGSAPPAAGSSPHPSTPRTAGWPWPPTPMAPSWASARRRSPGPAWRAGCSRNAWGRQPAEARPSAAPPRRRELVSAVAVVVRVHGDPWGDDLVNAVDHFGRQLDPGRREIGLQLL